MWTDLEQSITSDIESECPHSWNVRTIPASQAQSREDVFANPCGICGVKKLERQTVMTQRDCPLCSPASEEAEEQQAKEGSSDFGEIRIETFELKCSMCGKVELRTYVLV